MGFKVYQGETTTGWDGVFSALQTNVYNNDSFFSTTGITQFNDAQYYYEIIMSNGTADQSVKIYGANYYDSSVRDDMRMGTISNISNGSAYEHRVPTNANSRYTCGVLGMPVTNYVILHDQENHSLFVFFYDENKCYRGFCLGYKEPNIDFKTLNTGFYLSVYQEKPTEIMDRGDDDNFVIYTTKASTTLRSAILFNQKRGSEGSTSETNQGFGMAVIDDTDQVAGSYLEDDNDFNMLANCFMCINRDSRVQFNMPYRLGVVEGNEGQTSSDGEFVGINSYSGRPFLVPFEMSIYSDLNGWYPEKKQVHIGTFDHIYLLRSDNKILPEGRYTMGGDDYIFIPYLYLGGVDVGEGIDNYDPYYYAHMLAFRLD